MININSLLLMKYTGWSNMTSQSTNNSNMNSTGFNNITGFGMGTMQPQQPLSTTLPQKQPAPDLSAFDSLLPSANKGTKGMSMNAMAHNKVPNKFRIY